MPFLDVGDGAFYYRHWVADQAESVVLLLHGYGEHTGHYHRLAAELTRTGSDVWAPDHVGHGLSGKPTGHFGSVGRLADNAEAVMGLARDTKSPLPLVLVGHSLGGLTAIQLAMRRPGDIAGLVLTGPPVGGSPQAASLPDSPVFSLDPSYLDDLATDPLGFDTTIEEESLWRAVDDFAAVLAEAPSVLQMPVMLIYGEHDVFTPPARGRDWASGLVNATFVEVDGGYHDIVNDVSHRLVASKICDFIASVAAKGAHTRTADAG